MRLCIKPEIQERGTECKKREEWGEFIIIIIIIIVIIIIINFFMLARYLHKLIFT